MRNSRKARDAGIIAGAADGVAEGGGGVGAEVIEPRTGAAGAAGGEGFVWRSGAEAGSGFVGPIEKISPWPLASNGLLIPSGGDLLRIDPTTGHVQKYYGAEIDAVWGMNSVALSPNRPKTHEGLARAREARSAGVADDGAKAAIAKELVRAKELERQGAKNRLDRQGDPLGIRMRTVAVLVEWTNFVGRRNSPLSRGRSSLRHRLVVSNRPSDCLPHEVF